MSRPIRPGNAGLVGLPVFLTAIFCFAMVFSHSTGRNSDARTVSSVGDVSHKTAINAPGKPSNTLQEHRRRRQDTATASKPGGGAQTSQLHVGSAGSNEASSSRTDTPQPSSNAAKNLQGAEQNDGSSGTSIIKSTVNAVEKQGGDLLKKL